MALTLTLSAACAGDDGDARSRTDASVAFDAPPAVDAAPGAAGAWAELGQVDSADGSSERVIAISELVVDDAGGVTSIWQQGGFAVGSSTSRVWGNHYTPGSGWATPVKLQGDPRHGYGDLTLVGDRDGSAMAIWTQRQGYPADTTPFDLWANRYVPGTGWTGATRLEDAPGAADRPVAWVDGAHRIHVIWRQWIDDAAQLRGARFDPASGWTPAVQLSGTGADESGFDDIAVDEAGDVVAVFVDGGYGPGLHRVWANRLSAGAGWGVPVMLDSVDGRVGRVDLAGNRRGDVVAVWSRLDATDTAYSVVSARFTAAAGWESATALEHVTADASMARVAIDGSGRATAVWTQPVTNGHVPWTSRFEPGLGWTPPELLTTEAAGDRPSVVADRQGNVTAAWRAGPTIGVRRFVPGLGWQPPTFVREADNPAPVLAIAAGGRVAMARWHDRWHLAVSACCAP